MAKKKAVPKKTGKKKSGAKKKSAASAKMAAKAKASARKSSAKRAKKRVRAVPTIQQGSQSVETVQLRPRRMAARAGAGGGDFGGVSVVEGPDSESAEELLEEGQAFEAGIISGVERAGNADESEVITHEVPQDDVPEEYDEKDRS
jgi:hypothetical protein